MRDVQRHQEHRRRRGSGSRDIATALSSPVPRAWARGCAVPGQLLPEPHGPGVREDHQTLGRHAGPGPTNQLHSGQGKATQWYCFS